MPSKDVFNLTWIGGRKYGNMSAGIQALDSYEVKLKIIWNCLEKLNSKITIIVISKQTSLREDIYWSRTLFWIWCAYLIWHAQ